MSNIKSERFSLSQFAVSLGALCAKTDDRAIAIAEFLSVQLEKASRAWLLGGSDSLNQALAKIESSGKASVAVKLRKVIRSVSFEGFSAWGTLQAFSVTPHEGLIGGNSERAKDKPQRAEACTAYGEAIRATTLRIFAKAIPDAGHVDPLAFAGAYSPKTIGLKLASATTAELINAINRIEDLTRLIQLALDLRDEAVTEPAAVEPTVTEPAAVEPTVTEPAKRAARTSRARLAA